MLFYRDYSIQGDLQVPSVAASKYERTMQCCGLHVSEDSAVQTEVLRPPRKEDDAVKNSSEFQTASIQIYYPLEGEVNVHNTQQ